MARDLMKAAEAKALGLTIDELEQWQRDDEDRAEASSAGVELWELRMIREGASPQAMEERRLEKEKKMAEILGMSFEDWCQLNPRNR